MTQVEAAAMYRVPRVLYSQAERDFSGVVQVLSPMLASEMTTPEKCLILRRRGELTQSEVAESLGVCRRTMILMELGQASPEPLLRYWGL
jgi:DNA-binding transcriptional regulator YiaG